jgi:hypothetical protein
MSFSGADEFNTALSFSAKEICAENNSKMKNILGKFWFNNLILNNLKL